jgi:hypothetical protein
MKEMVMPAEEVAYPPEIEDLKIEFQTLIQKISENISQQAVEPAVKAAHEQREALESSIDKLNKQGSETRRLFDEVLEEFRAASLKVTRKQKSVFDHVIKDFGEKQNAGINHLSTAANHLKQTCDEVADDLNEYHDDHVSQMKEIRGSLQNALTRIAEKHESLTERYDSLANDRRQELKKALGFLEEVRTASLKSRITFRICFFLLFLFQVVIFGMFLHGAGFIKF